MADLEENAAQAEAAAQMAAADKITVASFERRKPARRPQCAALGGLSELLMPQLLDREFELLDQQGPRPGPPLPRPSGPLSRSRSIAVGGTTSSGTESPAPIADQRITIRRLSPNCLWCYRFKFQRSAGRLRAPRVLRYPPVNKLGWRDRDTPSGGERWKILAQQTLVLSATAESTSADTKKEVLDRGERSLHRNNYDVLQKYKRSTTLERSSRIVSRSIHFMTQVALPKKKVEVLGRQMAYHERGEGQPILFLHGNPTSSFLWRNVIPELEGLGRLIAPDLIGTGDSDKLPNVKPDTYSFQTHRYHLWAFIDAVIKPTEKILFVIHDWGSAYGFDWAKHNPNRVRGIAYMEGIVRPYKNWEEWSAIIPVFQGFRSPEGERMILDENNFVEKVLFGTIPKLSEAEYAEYRRPFLKREDRWPTLKWPRSIPIAGEPADVVAIVESYAAFMAQNEIPKFFVSANPGAILTGAPREFCRTWKNQTEIMVEGQHFIQENSGATIGKGIAAWIKEKSL